MSSPYVGEIRMFAGNFAPLGWAFCQGQLLPISENDTLFNLIGTTYGGDGQETFALPNLASRVPIHQFQGPGLPTNYQIGQMLGVEQVTLTVQQIPNHTHPMLASTSVADQTVATNQVLANSSTAMMYFEDNPNAAMNANSVTPIGGSQPHENTQPYLCINFIISLFGVFPSQN